MATDRGAAAGVAAGTLLLVVALQAWSGAYHSEFGAHPDESAHYVTGVMVREYVAARAPRSPLAFAQAYYDHYPKVAIGHWPPGFYVLQAAWTLPFSPARASVLLLMAALTAALATTLFVALRPDVGPLPAAAAALLLAALPLVQKASGMIMAEVPLALFCFWAVLAFGRFLDQGRAADAVRCGLAAAAAILTKGNAFALALAMPLTLLLSGRWARLARPAPWAAAALAAALCAPWFVVTAAMTAENFAAGRPTLGYAAAAALLYGSQLAGAGGLGLALLAAVGVAARVAHPWRHGAMDAKWAAAAALLLATWAFHCVVPSSREPRHMVMALPAFMMFVAAGVEATARWASKRRPQFGRWNAAAVAGAVVLFLADGFAVPGKKWSGFSAPLDLLLRPPSAAPSVMLIVSDVRGEGMFISELARREPRPHRRVLRGSKVLARSGWNGEGYTLAYSTAAEVLAFLEGAVEMVVLDTSGVTAGEGHLELMTETVRRHPDRFERLGSFPVTRAGAVIDRPVEVWRLRPGLRPAAGGPG